MRESRDMATHPSADPPVTEFAGQLFFRPRATHARRGSAWLRRPDAGPVRAPERHQRSRGSDSAGARLGAGHRSQHDGLADRSAGERRAGQAPAVCHGPPGQGDCDHAQGPPAPAAGSGADFSGRRQGSGRAYRRGAPRAADAASPRARLSTRATIVELRRRGLAPDRRSEPLPPWRGSTSYGAGSSRHLGGPSRSRETPAFPADLGRGSSARREHVGSRQYSQAVVRTPAGGCRCWRSLSPQGGPFRRRVKPLSRGGNHEVRAVDLQLAGTP